MATWWLASTKSAFRLHVFEAFPALAETQASAITPHQIAAVVRKVREKGRERVSGMLRSYLSAAFNAAKKAPFDSALPADLIAFEIVSNPVDAIPAIPVKRGNHVLSIDDLRG